MGNAKIRFLALQVRMGRITIDQVPENLRAAVQKQLK